MKAKAIAKLRQILKNILLKSPATYDFVMDIVTEIMTDRALKSLPELENELAAEAAYYEMAEMIFGSKNKSLQ